MIATPSDYAQQELDIWQRALEDQRDAERELKKARAQRARLRVQQLLPQGCALTIRADLLLAEAVKVKCTFRDFSFGDTLSGELWDRGDAP